MSAVLFGSISTVADTSELQREAFNAAFAKHGLDWQWDRDDYRSMLDTSGGQDRIAEYGKAHGTPVDAAAVHRTKSQIFQERVGAAGLSPRPGVLDTIRSARSAGMRLGLVTSTSPENIDALLGALGPDLGRDTFDVIVDATEVTAPKPDSAAYDHALEALELDAAACIAIEDNLGGVAAAKDAGLVCVAFPNANTAGHDFAAADRRVESLDLDELRPLLSA